MTAQSYLGGTFTFTNTSITVSRMGYGAMRLAGQDGKKMVWGPPAMFRARLLFCARPLLRA